MNHFPRLKVVTVNVLVEEPDVEDVVEIIKENLTATDNASVAAILERRDITLLDSGVHVRDVV